MDIKLQLEAGAEPQGLILIRRLQLLSPTTRVLVMTAYDDAELVVQALEHGAMGYILKGDAIESRHIQEGIAVVAAGGSRFSTTVMAHLRSRMQPPAPALAPLTRCEEQVLELIAAGATNKEIARELVITEKTVKTHVSNILSKYQIKSRYQAARIHRPPDDASAYD